MRILLDDGMQIAKGTGIGKYSENLLIALRNFPGVEVEHFDAAAFLGEQKISRLKYLKCINSRSFVNFAEKFDVCIFTNYVIPIRRLHVKTIAVVHDLVAFDMPETLPPVYRIYNRAAIRLALMKADLIITVSKTMASEIKKRFPNNASKVSFAWPGVVSNIHREKERTEYDDPALAELAQHPFFLFVSTIERRKNVEFVIEAFAELHENCKEARSYMLVLAGRPGYGFERIKRTARNLGVENYVLFTGYVSNGDCNRLYNSAAAFVFPTSYEGFGFAQLECMECGLPILLSDIPVNREISRSYGIYFSLESTEELVSGMLSIVGNEVDRDFLTGISEEYLKDFSWAETARIILDACKEHA